MELFDFDQEAMRHKANQLAKSIAKMTGVPLVLVVDDDDNDIFLTRRELQKFQCDATYCNDPARSVELLKEQKFDLIFIDMIMPKFTGMDVIQMTNGTQNHGQKFIGVTGSEDSVTLSKAIRSGAVFMVFPKPLTEEKLELFLRKKPIHVD